MINLNANEQFLAKKFFKAISSAYYDGRFWDWMIIKGSVVKAKVAPIIEEIAYRNFSFITKKLDDVLNTIQQSIGKLRTANAGWVTRKAEDYAKYIAWFCQENGIIWDDSTQTKPLMDAYIQTTLGQALYKAERFMNTKPNQQARTSTRATSQRQPGQAPINGYKSTGPHSGDIPNLIGVVGLKQLLSGDVFCIEADKIGKNTPNAFITPLKTNNSGIITIARSSAEEVRMGSGNGYTDGKLWFDSLTDANTFLTNVAGKFGAKFTNYHVAKKHADNKGYFKVSTEFGNAYIKASVLNEEFEEKLKENVTSQNDRIGDIEIYDEWLKRSVC